MVTLLARLWIRDRQNYSAPQVRLAYGMLCGCVGIGLNLLLFCGKLFAGSLSGSIAMTADAFNNLSDAGSSIVTLAGFRMAGQKADCEHPFGHGRIEYVAGLIVSMIILLMGVELLKVSVEKILRPEPVTFSLLALAVLAGSILVKLYMYFYNARIGKRIDSAAMRATALDSFSDVASTAVVLLSMLVARWTGLSIDGYAGVLVALFILYTGFTAAKETISPLLGEPPTKAYVEQIEQLVLSYPEIIGVHDLVVHNYGPGRAMISLHAEVPASGDLIHLHDTVDNIEKRLRDTMGCSAVIHMDPVDTDDVETARLKTQVEATLAEIDKRWSIHDFRVVKGPTHTNLVFDVVIPYTLIMSDEQVRRRIVEAIGALDSRYYAIIEIDKSSLR